MKTSILVIILATISLSPVEAASPYAGEENRSIKSLSQNEVEGYLNGKGMGYAKAAELNRYPGPMHVLELAQQIGLNEEQQQQTERLYEAMKEKASDLGKMLVEKERELDAKFDSGTISPEALAGLVREIGAIEAEIRLTHLGTHLAQRDVMTEEQIACYVSLRGYGNGHRH